MKTVDQPLLVDYLILYRIETDSVPGLMYNCACKYYITIVYDSWKQHNKLDFECKYWCYLFVNILWTNKNLGLPCCPENIRPSVNEWSHYCAPLSYAAKYPYNKYGSKSKFATC